MLGINLETGYGLTRPALGYQFTEPTPDQKPYSPRGAALALFYCKDPVVLLDGPAGTGKTRALLEKALMVMELYAGVRVLLLRKTRRSLTQSALVTWETKVLPPGWRNVIPFNTTDQEYRHPNGSIMAVAGLDDPAKVMSTEWDLILIPEATELTEAELEYLTTRNRNFGGGMDYQQIVMDCNPQGPKHWLNVRCETPVDARYPSGQKLITRLKSRHKDNPEYWDEALQKWTDRGRVYLIKLKRLTGVRFYRLFKGLWRQSEGAVFDEWDPDTHLVFRREVPDYWPRIWGVDFGYTNPFVWQEWAIDPDGRLWLIHEIYHTKRLVSDMCKDIIKVTGNVRLKPIAVVCDHDAEGRATMERELRLKTVPAYKESILENVEAVRRRLRRAGDGLPRLFMMRDSLFQLDRDLAEARLPTHTADEMEGHVWADNRKDGKDRPERPVDENDHGINAMEYVVGYIDKINPKRSGGVRVGNRVTG